MVGAHDYKEEMLDTLDRSDPRDISMFSPPIVYLNQEAGDLNWSQNLISTSESRFSTFSTPVPFSCQKCKSWLSLTQHLPGCTHRGDFLHVPPQRR